MLLMEYFKEADIFGHKFNIKVRSKDSYKTTAGAICSIIFLAFMVGLVFYESLRIVNENQYHHYMNEAVLNEN